MDGPDSLEDWVAIKQKPFPTPRNDERITFYCSWNPETSQIAINYRIGRKKVSRDNCADTTALFTIEDIYGVHNELCLVYPELDQYLPDLPRQHYDIMSLFSSVEMDSSDVCEKIRIYLTRAADICGQKMVLSTLFGDQDKEEYFESLSDFRRKRLDDDIVNAEDELNNVIFLRNTSVTMIDISSVYVAEDEAISRLNVALAALYNYQLQPFLDLREVSYQKMRSIRQELNDPDSVGELTKDLARQFSDGQAHYTRALDFIEETYVTYYTRTVAIINEAYERMLGDQKLFGKMAFQISGQERLDRLAEELSLERQQLLKSQKRLLENQRDKIKYEIASLDESPKTIKQAEKLERRCYNKQVDILSIQLDILDEEDKLLKLKIAKIHRINKENENDLVFYDAVEDLDDLEEEDIQNETNPELVALSQARVKVNRTRAGVRNKKRALQSKFKDGENKKAQEVETFVKHHQVQIKRDKEAEEKKAKQTVYDEERRKTLCRLREYRMKYKPPRPAIRRSKLNNMPSLQYQNLQASTLCPASLQPMHESTSLSTMKVPPPPPPPPTSAPVPPPPPPPPAPLRRASVEKPPFPGVQVKPHCPLKNQGATSKHEDPINNMMEMIRRGVKLRSVESRESPTQPPSENHAVYLQQVLKRIGKSTCPISDSEEQESDSDFD